MRIVLGIICVLFGGIAWGGQVLSTINYPLAQRLGLQEKTEGTDTLHRRTEINAARWDSFVLWTLPVSGSLMLTNNHWWPYFSLIAGGIYFDVAGREVAKLLSLRGEGIRIGTPQELKFVAAFFFTMFIIATGVIIYSLWFLAEQIAILFG